MARYPLNVLSDTEIRNAKPHGKPYKLRDGGGLYLTVTPDGSKLWRFRYDRPGGGENMLSVGKYPDVSLKKARERRTELRGMLEEGVDPGIARQQEREAQQRRESDDDRFRTIGQEWLDRHGKNFAAKTMAKSTWILGSLVYPHIGDTPIRQIVAPDVLRLLRRIESDGLLETAYRTKQRISQIFRYAVATGRADADVTLSLRGALAPVKTKHRAAIVEPRRVGELLRAIDGYQGQPAVMAALKLAPIVFVRPGELRGAEWSEFDLEAAEWRIPEQRMKMGERHIVPLSKQAIAILEWLRDHTGHGRLLFPSLRSLERPISDNTLNAALRRLGYSGDEQVAHGFRTIASTLLNEMGWNADLIELQLAHKPRDDVRSAYNRAERLPERRKMMQAWADHLDALKADTRGKIASLRRR